MSVWVKSGESNRDEKNFPSKKTPTHRSPREGTDDTTNKMQSSEGLLPSPYQNGKSPMCHWGKKPKLMVGLGSLKIAASIAQ